jgi:hypothetical protein
MLQLIIYYKDIFVIKNKNILIVIDQSIYINYLTISKAS